MSKTATIDNKAPVKRRISPKVRHAISLKVVQGLTWAKAADKAGMSEAGIHKARKLPHVQEYAEQVKIQLIEDVDSMKAPYKAQAIEVAHDLMHNGKSETVRIRAVEFFASEGKGNGVNVAVQINNSPAQGYEYVRPDQKVVDIVDAVDTQSVGQDDETLIKQGK
jgi:hypothetical protein